MLELLAYYIMLQQHIDRGKLSAAHAQAHKVLHCANSKKCWCAYKITLQIEKWYME